jgi:glyoxylase-like metal-dependent hydrolase (beta-lactamase superfamily II)
MQKTLAALLITLTAAACTSATGPAPTPTRLYVLDGGALMNNLPVVAYLIVHSRGSLLWEGGTIPDALIEQGASASRPAVLDSFKAVAHKPIKSQLAEIGYSPDRVTFFASSHYHFDHIANANDYAGSTWLVQKAEKDAMFATTPPQYAEPAFYAALKTAKTVVLDGTHDVFGDGTVVVKPAPGHTPGHQVLFVRLANTGPVILSGDVYHAPEERSKPLETVPAMDVVPDQSKTTRTMLESFVKETGAALWIAHDGALFAQQKKSPDFYD